MKRIRIALLTVFLTGMSFVRADVHVPYAPQEVQMARHIAQLESENKWLMERMASMQGQLDVVVGAYEEYANFSWWQVWPLSLIQDRVHKTDELYEFLSLFGLVFLGLWVWMQNANRQAKQTYQAQKVVNEPSSTVAEHEEDEYNYLASRDALPAKLDLARAYIAMEDYSSAQEVLSEVMKLGDAGQKEEAQGLFNALPASS